MELYHHGIKGMHWGVRRFQNEDGSLTPAGKARLDEYKKSEVEKSANYHDEIISREEKKANKYFIKSSKAMDKGNVNKAKKLDAKGGAATAHAVAAEYFKKLDKRQIMGMSYSDMKKEKRAVAMDRATSVITTALLTTGINLIPGVAGAMVRLPKNSTETKIGVRTGNYLEKNKSNSAEIAKYARISALSQATYKQMEAMATTNYGPDYFEKMHKK